MLAYFPAGVRYIGEDLIRKVSGQDQLEQITSLNLTLARDSGKIKVNYICFLFVAAMLVMVRFFRLTAICLDVVKAVPSSNQVRNLRK